MLKFNTFHKYTSHQTHKFVTQDLVCTGVNSDHHHTLSF